MREILFISLGCDKNLVDSEQMMSILSGAGYGFTDDPEEAEIVVINSCCFIGDAKKESIDAVIEAGSLKEKGKVRFVVVTGCLAERYSDEIREMLPEVDAVIGTTAFDEIARVLDGLYNAGENDGTEILKKDIDTPVNPSVKRFISTPGHYEYLKIAEGCEKNCTYCIIPKIRGRYRSIPVERLVSDATALVSEGVKELILIAQETTLYGTDLYGKKMLPSLLKELSGIEGLKWIRLMYCYPEEIDDELIKAIRDLPKVVKYLDMPVQHCSDRILKRMGRRATKRGIENLMEKLRKEIPGIAIRTTLIAGFPGESEEDHAELLEFVRNSRFDRLGVFPYSPEEGTKAALFPDQTDEEIKIKRMDEIMTLQKEISSSVNKGFVGTEMDCITEGRIPDEGVYAARSYRDAPEVDGMVFIPETPGLSLMTGDPVRVRITGYSEYDLEGEVI